MLYRKLESDEEGEGPGECALSQERLKPTETLPVVQLSGTFVAEVNEMNASLATLIVSLRASASLREPLRLQDVTQRQAEQEAERGNAIRERMQQERKERAS